MTTSRIINKLIELDRQYDDFQKARKGLEQRVWAICARALRDTSVDAEGFDRAFDKKKVTALCSKVMKRKADDPLLAGLAEPFVAAFEAMLAEEQKVKNAMTKLVVDLPAYEWVQRQHGAGVFNFARVIAAAGRDLGDYETPAKLWRRFGLAVFDGKAEAPQKGQQLAYSPRRRAVAYNLSESLMKGNGWWKGLYDYYKQCEHDKAKEAGKTVKPAGEITPKQKASGEFMSDGHVHKRALRHMVKMFLRLLWEEWTGDKRENDHLPEFLREAA